MRFRCSRCIWKNRFNWSFNSLYEIRPEKSNGIGPSKNLSILSMRFWPAVLGVASTRSTLLSILSMRFWHPNNSLMMGEHLRPFNSLYEILRWCRALEIPPSAFNSLYEIHVSVRALVIEGSV